MESDDIYLLESTNNTSFAPLATPNIGTTTGAAAEERERVTPSGSAESTSIATDGTACSTPTVYPLGECQPRGGREDLYDEPGSGDRVDLTEYRPGQSSNLSN